MAGPFYAYTLAVRISGSCTALCTSKETLFTVMPTTTEATIETHLASAFPRIPDGATRQYRVNMGQIQSGVSLSDILGAMGQSMRMEIRTCPFPDFENNCLPVLLHADKPAKRKNRPGGTKSLSAAERFPDQVFRSGANLSTPCQERIRELADVYLAGDPLTGAQYGISDDKQWGIGVKVVVATVLTEYPDFTESAVQAYLRRQITSVMQLSPLPTCIDTCRA